MFSVVYYFMNWVLLVQNGKKYSTNVWEKGRRALRPPQQSGVGGHHPPRHSQKLATMICLIQAFTTNSGFCHKLN